MGRRYSNGRQVFRNVNVNENENENVAVAEAEAENEVDVKDKNVIVNRIENTNTITNSGNSRVNFEALED
ncbi:hypothetical protein ACFFIX_27445 [Metabacillus herbersteinensis]|uniref:Uncharacterized protein n=1 Tax=Metabacillus herbersteinensis TaxID=283816 RepID=A0ABV6GMW7_9BACI